MITASLLIVLAIINLMTMIVTKQIHSFFRTPSSACDDLKDHTLEVLSVVGLSLAPFPVVLF